ncbi:MAG: hypothetical protein HY562_10895 [Ignavibacteriales bacterium]|nr:hypothetical protein [Ignavibacteriales bacterium]
MKPPRADELLFVWIPDNISLARAGYVSCPGARIHRVQTTLHVHWTNRFHDCIIFAMVFLMCLIHLHGSPVRYTFYHLYSIAIAADVWQNNAVRNE